MWLRTGLPVSNFRSRRISAPTYGVEHDLDHYTSYLHSVVAAAVDRTGNDHSRRASQELIELERINAELLACGLSKSDLAPYSEYIDATRSLLNAIIKTSSPG